MISLPYGNTRLELRINDYFIAEPDVYISHQINRVKLLDDLAIQETLQNYQHKWSLNENTSVAITVNDPTRPFPHELILPALLHYLEQQSVRRENISIYISTGTHQPPTTDELSVIIPKPILAGYRTYVHNCDKEENLSYLGLSQAGTPIYVNKQFYKSDIKIVTGQIEPHHFMGFSGGVKSAVIGLGGRKTIEANHKMLSKPETKMNRYLSNPMRMDIEDIGERIGINGALNVVLDDMKNVIGMFFDHPRRVMEKGIELSRQICQIEAPSNYDLVICSAGGYPKDINLYQAQKAITHASSFVRDGGVILLIAECQNGLGSEEFTKFIDKYQSPSRVIHAFENLPFSIGPHKAYQLALQSQKYHIILISELIDAKTLVEMITLTNDLKKGLEFSRQWLTDKAKIAVLPFATHIMNRSGSD